MQWVAPLAGAWIEIGWRNNNLSVYRVAPLAGAWIEIFQLPVLSGQKRVAPLAGAWIEIYHILPLPSTSYSRSPRGSVD